MLNSLFIVLYSKTYMIITISTNSHLCHCNNQNASMEDALAAAEKCSVIDCHGKGDGI